VSFGCGALLAIRLGRESMQNQVASQLQGHAQSVLSAVEELLSQRRTDVRVWASLDVMDDVRSRDRDFRIETLLLRLEHEYAGAYRELSVLDSNGVIVASTEVGRVDSKMDPHAMGLADDRRSQLL